MDEEVAAALKDVSECLVSSPCNCVYVSVVFSAQESAAIAAMFSAVSSFLIMLIHYANRRDAARPVFFVTGWGRVRRGETDVIRFQTVRNLGKGPAFNIVLNCFHEHEELPTAMMSAGTSRLPILGPMEAQDINCEIVLWWENVPRRQDGSQYLFITLTVAGTDALSISHETEYPLTILPAGQAIGDETAPGLLVSAPKTKSTSPSRRKLLLAKRQAMERARTFFDRRPW